MPEKDPSAPSDEELAKLEKIARRAVERGYWQERNAREGVAMAKLHTTGPRLVFLKKLLERTCGLTYDEVARLEKEALAPPLAQTPAKPLPKLGAPKPASSPENEALGAPRELGATPKPLPRLGAPRPPSEVSQIALPPSPEATTPSRPLPKLGVARPELPAVPTEPPPPTAGPVIVERDTEVVSKAKLPKLSGERKAAEPPAPSPEDVVITKKPLPKLNAPKKPSDEEA